MKQILTFLLILTTFLLSAQTATLTGKVTDAANNEPLISATVQAGETGAITDYDGTYTLELAAGTYTITASYVGYAPLEKSVTLQAGATQTLDFALGSASILQTATVTSGRFERPLGEVTVSLDVIQPQLLENTNTTSVDQVLEKVPGVNIIDGQANIRGGSGYSYGAGSRVLLLVDDVPILQADAGYPNWNDIPIENISQIEVVKGAASALYGSSAMNGIINIRTAYPTAEPETKIALFGTGYLKPSNEAAQWWDSPPLNVGLSAAHRQRFGKLDVVLGGLYLDGDGVMKDTYTRYGRLNANLRYRVNDKLSFGLYMNGNKGESSSFFYWKGIDSLYYIGEPSSYSEGKRFRYNIDPRVTYFDNAGNRHKLLGRIFIIDNDFNNGQSNGSQLYYSEYQFQRNFSKIDLVTTAGLVSTATSVNAELYGDTMYTSLNLAAYLQLEKKFFNRLNTSFGFRYERNTLNSPEVVAGETIPDGKTVESKPVFRFGLNYQAAEYTFLRASWGQGYRYPTIAEKFIQTTIAGGVQVIPNPNLQSETGWTAEFGVKQGFRISSFEGFVDVAAFWSEYQDMMEFNVRFKGFSPGFQSNNVGNTIIKGVELSVMGRGSLFGLPTTILTGYTYIDPQFQDFDLEGKKIPINFNPDNVSIGQINARLSTSDENILKYRFQHTVKVDVESKITPHFSFGVAAFYNSYMEAIDYAFVAFEQNFNFIPGMNRFRATHDSGSTIINFRAAYFFTEKIKLSLLLNNAFNTEYSLRPGTLEGPRNMGIRLDYSF